MQQEVKYHFFSARYILCFACLLIPFLVLAQDDGDNDYSNEEAVNERVYFLNKEQGNPPVLHERSIDEKKIAELKDKDEFWYANTDIVPEKSKKKETSSAPYVPIGQRSWFQTLLWIVIIGGFAAAVAWFLKESRVKVFRKKDIGPSGSNDEEDIGEDIFSINYQKKIDDAVKSENYRLAVRLGFLRLLRDMSKKNIINYKQDRTNFDYLLQLHSSPFYEQFFNVTRSYEYTWYGQFEINELAYHEIKKDFDHLEGRLRTH